MRWVTGSAQETQNIGGLIAGLAEKGDVVALSGDLGMGKTTFAKGFIKALVPGIKTVASPTFTLVNVYEATLVNGKKIPLWHADLYRLKSAADLEELGLGDIIGEGILIIEWPELAKDILPDDILNIRLNATDAVDTREILATGRKNWAERLED